MKKKNKNIILIVVIIVLCGGIFLTGYLSTKSFGNGIPNIELRDKGDFHRPNRDMIDDNKDNDEMKTHYSETDSNSDEGGDEKSDESSDEIKNRPEMENDKRWMKPNFKRNRFNWYIVIFGIESLLLSALVLYLVMSKFNAKTFKETFAGLEKKLIYVLGVIILASGLTFGEKLITDKIISNHMMEERGMHDEKRINESNSNIEDTQESTTQESGS